MLAAIYASRNPDSDFVLRGCSYRTFVEWSRSEANLHARGHLETDLHGQPRGRSREISERRHSGSIPRVRATSPPPQTRQHHNLRPRSAQLQRPLYGWDGTSECVHWSFTSMNIYTLTCCYGNTCWWGRLVAKRWLSVTMQSGGHTCFFLL